MALVQNCALEAPVALVPGYAGELSLVGAAMFWSGATGLEP